MNKAILATLFVAFSGVAAFGQDNVPPVIALPGSVNASFGNVGSLEPGNVVGGTTIEQGVTVWRRGSLFVAGFCDVGVRGDSLGYAWNNNVTYLTGGKVVVAGRAGVLQAAAGVTGAAHGETASKGATPAGHLSYWAGWHRDAGAVQLPGSVWATSGITAATEPDNWITSAHMEQGVAVKRVGRVAMVPFAAVTATSDSRNRPWNNRGLLDAGIKLTTHVGTAAIDAGVAQRATRQWHGGSGGAAPIAFVNVWLGWMPHVTR